MCTIQQKRVIGLIGGIGSGKSEVACRLEKEGALIISGDSLGHEALRQEDIKSQVSARWGSAVLTESGEISRSHLGRLVFANPDELRNLERMVFPYIEKRIEEEIARAQDRQEVRVIVLDAAVLLEAGWDRFCDWVVYVHTPLDVRRRRLGNQRRWTEQEEQQRAKAQMSLTEKVTRADLVVDNSGEPAALEPQIRKILAWVMTCQPPELEPLEPSST
jgi:dephospho-CoA kinase